MKRIISAIMILSLSVLCFLPGHAEDTNIIRVTGNANVAVTADQAMIQIGVESKDKDILLAMSKNTESMNSVIQKLQEAGIDEKDMITSNFNIYSGFDYEENEISSSRAETFFVTNTLSVTVRDLTKISEYIAIAVNAGSNQMYGLVFSSTQENAAYQQALTRAFEDAASKAKVLADAANVSLGDLLTIDAQNINFSYGISNSYKMESAAADGAAVLSGDLSVSASVVLTYQISR